MRVPGLTPCFFPVCEGLGGVGDPGCDCRRCRRAGGTLECGGTLEWDGEPPRMGGGPLEWDGEPLEWDGEPPRMGWGGIGMGLALGLVYPPKS